MMKIFLPLILFIFFSISAFASKTDTVYIEPKVCDSLTTIYFTISKNDTISLDVYNRWGENIGSFFQKTVLPKGNYAISYVADTLTEGIYLVSFERNSKRKGMTFIKSDSLADTVINNKEAFNIYPNPCDTSTSLYFSLLQKDIISLDIFDLNDNFQRSFFHKIALPEGNYKIYYDTKSLKPGVYWAKLTIGSRNINRRFVKVQSQLSINQEPRKTNISAYPNPVKNALTIGFPGEKNIIIADINGKIILKKRLDENIMDLSEILPGTYFIRIFNANAELLIQQKIIKIN